MENIYLIGDLKLRISNKKILDLIPSAFGKFLLSLDEQENFSIECKKISRAQFEESKKKKNKTKKKEYGIYQNFFFLDKESIIVKQEFNKRKIKVFYASDLVWELIDNYNNLGFVTEKKILSNLSFWCNQLCVYNNRIILHGSGLIKDKQAYIFLAMDNGGKTTLIKRNRNHRIINDDQIFYSIKNHQVFAYATPFGRLSDGPGSAPVAAFFYINKSKRFSIKKRNYKGLINSFWMDNYETFASLPKDLKKKAFKLISDISMSVPIFELHADHGNIDWDQVDKVLKNT